MISERDAANVLRYLLAAQAITATDDQAAVWADYLNHDLTDLNADELLPAARLALSQWSRERAWKLDLPRYADAIRYNRRQQIAAYTRLHGPPQPEGDLDGITYLKRLRAAHSAIRAGAGNPNQLQEATTEITQ